MTQIMIDSASCDQLTELEDAAEIVDGNGRVIGLFTPVLQPPYESAWIPPMSQEEFERAVTQGEGITTDELMRRLQSL